MQKEQQLHRKYAIGPVALLFVSALILSACDWKGTGPQPESGATPEGPGLLSGKDGKFVIIGD
ncbi:hypothetical protein ACTL6U_05215 [Rhodovibrionaceae bacterium A322]